MGWRYVAPGIILMLVKFTGTSLFVAFIPQIFPRGNISFVPEENDTVPQTIQSPPENSTTTPLRFTTAVPQTTQHLPESPMTSPVTGTITVQVPELRWENYGGNVYGFSEHMLDWMSSYLECDSRSSILLIISDQNEMEFLQNKTRNADYFIGLEYQDDTHKWFWINGVEPKGDLFTMKPNGVNQQCATLRGIEVSPTSCHDQKHWICKILNG